jgi:SAM-dependent methyltransferase
MFNKFFQNTRKPQGIGGAIMLWSMNWGHARNAKWGLQYLSIEKEDIILDIGCGGGKNIARMLKLASLGQVNGLDYAELSVEKSRKLNRTAVLAGKSDIREGSVQKIPWEDDRFDIVTAFETIYFWPDFEGALQEIRRVLKPDGIVFICNESVKPENGEMPYQGFVKMLDLKMYSRKELENALLKAGFESIYSESREPFVCVTGCKSGKIQFA